MKSPSPTERLERLQPMTRFYEEAQQARLRRQSQKASWTAGPAEAPALSNDESYSKI